MEILKRKMKMNDFIETEKRFMETKKDVKLKVEALNEQLGQYGFTVTPHITRTMTGLYVSKEYQLLGSFDKPKWIHLVYTGVWATMAHWDYYTMENTIDDYAGLDEVVVEVKDENVIDVMVEDLEEYIMSNLLEIEGSMLDLINLKESEKI